MRQDNGILLAVYDICLNEDGTLAQSRRINPDEPAKGIKWYAYMEYAADDPWFNNHPYVDTLRPEAIGEFIADTHEIYAKQVGEYFGGVVPPSLPMSRSLPLRKRCALRRRKGMYFCLGRTGYLSFIIRYMLRTFLHTFPSFFGSCPAASFRLSDGASRTL